jgi:hypothetical protein
MSRQLHSGSSRISHAPRPTTTGAAGEPMMRARLLEKCQEHDAFGRIADQSRQLADHFQELNQKTDILLDGGQGRSAASPSTPFCSTSAFAETLSFYHSRGKGGRELAERVPSSPNCSV